MLSLQVLYPKPTDNSIMGECGKMVLFHPCEREPHHGVKLVVLPTSAGCARVTLVLICLMIHVWWPDKPSVTSPTPLKPNKPRRRRSKGPRRFAGLIHQPRCEACEQGDDTRPQAPEWLFLKYLGYLLIIETYYQNTFHVAECLGAD
jgi:hypothetical protein